MLVTIKGTNIELDGALKEYVNKKLEGLNKFFKNFASDAVKAYVEIGKPSKHHRTGMIFYAEINLEADGKFLRSEANHLDLRYAVNKALEKLKRQIKK